MSIKHHYQSGRSDNGDPGAIQPSQWNADHDLTGMLALLDAIAPSPNTVVTLDGSNQLILQATASFAPTFSAQLTGVPTAPTPGQAVNSTQIATTEYVRTAITNLTGGAPGALDTLKELADAINDDASYASTVTAALGVRLRVDAAQGLTTGQKAQGISNLGINPSVLAAQLLANAIDLNTVLTEGTYFTNDTASTNGPAVTDWLFVKVEGASGYSPADLKQTVTALQSGETYTRIRLANVWGSWRRAVQLDSAGKLPAVDGSQLTGVTVTGSVLYNSSQTLTGDQKAVAQANLGGFPFNGQIVESHTAGAVTFAVKTPSGADPSATTPVVFRFPTGLGGYTYVAVTAALSITVPSGATLGTLNAQGFRLWIAAFNDAGTVRLAVRVCASFSFAGSWTNFTILSPPETRPASSTLTPANAAHTFYTAGAAVASKYWSWIAHATYEATIATAGTWNVSPDYISLVDAQTPRPGQVIQNLVNATAISLAPTDTTAHPLSSQNITPFSSANAIDIEADAQIYLRQNVANEQGGVFIARGASSIAAANSNLFTAAGAELFVPGRPRAFDKPNTGSVVTYNVMCQSVTAGLASYQSWNLCVREIMT